MNIVKKLLNITLKNSTVMSRSLIYAEVYGMVDHFSYIFHIIRDAHGIKSYLAGHRKMHILYERLIEEFIIGLHK